METDDGLNDIWRLIKKGIGKGADAVENLLDWCEEFDIKIVTLYALSAENLERKDSELEDLYRIDSIEIRKIIQ